VITIHQRHRQTDGRTDDMRSQDRALHSRASRGKNGSIYVIPIPKWSAAHSTHSISWRVACRSGNLAVCLLVCTGIYHGYYPMTYCTVAVHEMYFICSHLGIKWYLLETYEHQWTVISPDRYCTNYEQCLWRSSPSKCDYRCFTACCFAERGCWPFSTIYNEMWALHIE